MTNYLIAYCCFCSTIALVSTMNNLHATGAFYYRYSH